MAKYAALRVGEYYLYDPLQDLNPYLRGYRLVGSHYEPLPLHATGTGYYSEHLGTTLQVIGSWLRVIDPESGEPLLIPTELAAARREAEERAARQAEAARRATEHAQREAGRADREAGARRDAEAALAEALAELARLRGER
jgi:hypothetical protein